MVVVTEKGKIVAYERRFLETHTDLDDTKTPTHRKKCPCCETVIEEKPYECVENPNVYYFDIRKNRSFEEEPVQIIANNFENAKKALACGSKNNDWFPMRQIHFDICDMLKEKNPDLHVWEEKHTHRDIPKSKW